MSTIIVSVMGLDYGKEGTAGAKGVFLFKADLEIM